MISAFILIFFITPALAASILVDGIHGWTNSINNYLIPAFPEHEYTVVTADDFPQEELLAEGTIYVSDELLTFWVPEGVEVLYYRSAFSDPNVEQQPFITFYDPEGMSYDNVFNGYGYIENPIPGAWLYAYESWEPISTSYEFFTGPHFFSEELLAPYDLLLLSTSDVMQFFVGHTLPFTDQEEITLQTYLDDGGGFMLIREPELVIAWKPIVRLYSEEDILVDIHLEFPGQYTKIEPYVEPEYNRLTGLLDWDHIEVLSRETTELLYEGGFPEPLHYLAVHPNGDNFEVTNSGPFSLLDGYVFQWEKNVGFKTESFSRIEPGATVLLENSQIIPETDMRDYLTTALAAEGIHDGLTQTEMDEFWRKYHWVPRWLNDARESGQICAIYRFTDSAYDRLIPLNLDTPPQEIVRTMWVFVLNPPAEATAGLTLPELLEPQQPTEDENATWQYHEYGVIEERNLGNRPGERNMDLLGITYLDDCTLTDESGTWEPVLTQFGDQPEVSALTEDVSYIQCETASSLLIDNDQAYPVIMGDESCSCQPTIPTGGYPPLAAAVILGDGRMVGVNDTNIMQNSGDNHQFLANCLEWLTEEDGMMGDVNNDQTLNVLDVVTMVGFILGTLTPTPQQFWAADLNQDDEINIMDVVLLVSMMMGPFFAPDSSEHGVGIPVREDVNLRFNRVSGVNNWLEVFITHDIDLGAITFSVNGVEVEGVSGWMLDDYPMVPAVSGSTISLTGDYCLDDSGILLEISMGNTTADEICLEDVQITDCNGNSLSVEIGPCIIPPQCGQLGDMNGDQQINVLDIVHFVCAEPYNEQDPHQCSSPCESWEYADVNGDGGANILDLVIIIGWILNGLPE